MAVEWLRRAVAGVGSAAGGVGGGRGSGFAGLANPRVLLAPPLRRPLSSRVVLVRLSRRPNQRARRLSPRLPPRAVPSGPPRGERGSSFCGRQ